MLHLVTLSTPSRCPLTAAAWATPVGASVSNETRHWLYAQRNISADAAEDQYFSARARRHPFFHAGHKGQLALDPAAANAAVATAIATLDDFQSAGLSFADEEATQQLLCRLGLNNEHLFEFPRALAPSREDHLPQLLREGRVGQRQGDRGPGGQDRAAER